MKMQADDRERAGGVGEREREMREQGGWQNERTGQKKENERKELESKNKTGEGTGSERDEEHLLSPLEPFLAL